MVLTHCGKLAEGDKVQEEDHTGGYTLTGEGMDHNPEQEVSI